MLDIRLAKGFIRIFQENWNDYNFLTTFYVTVREESSEIHELGRVKIGFVGQTTSTSTFACLEKHIREEGEITALKNNCFSLGQSLEYYQAISKLPSPLKEEVLVALNDMVHDHQFLDLAMNEEVFGTSLLRTVTLSTIKGQFARVLRGGAILTDFDFAFRYARDAEMSDIDLSFNVIASSTPSTNIHAIIGTNGVGKTTILNKMTASIVAKNSGKGVFYFKDDDYLGMQPITNDYFSSLVSVSFSAFDSFTPPAEQADPSKGTCYYYIGLKDKAKPDTPRSSDDLRADCSEALFHCFHDQKKLERWKAAISTLLSDVIFADMAAGELEALEDISHSYFLQDDTDLGHFQEYFLKRAFATLEKMSTGHTIVLLTITMLVLRVEEKTLVLIDEPESHLHPPLLSAFIRATSDLLHNRNGVAIIATHSPVVLQEVPKSCVWKLKRSGTITGRYRPDIETFGENVGSLTSEVFGLEVEKSGFYDLLTKSVDKGGDFNSILEEYDQQLGNEGRIILRILLAERDNNNDHD